MVGLFFGSLFSFICKFKPVFNSSYTRIDKQVVPSKIPIHIGVFSGTPKKRLQTRVCTFSTTPTHWRPHTSQPYRAIGWICASNILKEVCFVISLKLRKTRTQSHVAFFTFSCQEANTLTDTKFSCKRIAEVGITINNFYFIPSRNSFSFLLTNTSFLNTTTSDYSVLMDKECSLHIEFKWFSWFCNPMEILHKSAKSSANSSKNSSTKPGWSWIPCFPTASMQSQLHLQTSKRDQDSEYTPVWHQRDDKNKIKISHVVMYTYAGNDCFDGIQKRARQSGFYKC